MEHPTWLQHRASRVQTRPNSSAIYDIFIFQIVQFIEARRKLRETDGLQQAQEFPQTSSSVARLPLDVDFGCWKCLNTKRLSFHFALYLQGLFVREFDPLWSIAVLHPAVWPPSIFMVKYGDNYIWPYYWYFWQCKNAAQVVNSVTSATCLETLSILLPLIPWSSVAKLGLSVCLFGALYISEQFLGRHFELLLLRCFGAWPPTRPTPLEVPGFAKTRCRGERGRGLRHGHGRRPGGPRLHHGHGGELRLFLHRSGPGRASTSKTLVEVDLLKEQEHQVWSKDIWNKTILLKVYKHQW